MEIDAETYVEKFRPSLMDVVYSWCNGASFAQICKMTDVFEGLSIDVFFKIVYFYVYVGTIALVKRSRA